MPDTYSKQGVGGVDWLLIPNLTNCQRLVTWFCVMPREGVVSAELVAGFQSGEWRLGEGGREFGSTQAQYSA